MVTKMGLLKKLCHCRSLVFNVSETHYACVIQIIMAETMLGKKVKFMEMFPTKELKNNVPKLIRNGVAGQISQRKEVVPKPPANLFQQHGNDAIGKSITI